MRKEYKYDVFISYKHTPLDIAISGRLQRKLERYRVSREIQEKTGKKKIDRVFRDKEELAAGADLNIEIEEQLRDSEFLIIICSVESKNSIWVNRELEIFLKHHDIRHVLPIIVDGEPADVYPKLLLEYGEPFAVDVRSKSTKGSLKRLDQQIDRLIAPILHCSYDELVQRQKRYRMQRLGLFSSAVAIVACVFLGYVGIQNQKLEAAYEKTQLEDARLLAKQAQISYDQGDRYTCLKYLLEAVSSEDGKRPVPAEVEYLLTKVTGVYHSGEKTDVPQAIFKQAEVNTYNYELLEEEEGSYLFTKSHNQLKVWDAKTLKLKTKITIPEIEDIGSLSESLLCDHHLILLYGGQMLYLYDYETGVRIWKLRLAKDIYKVIKSRKNDMVYIWDSNSLCRVDLKSGRKVSSNRIQINGVINIDETKNICMSTDEKYCAFISTMDTDEEKPETHEILYHTDLIVYDMENDKAEQLVMGEDNVHDVVVNRRNCLCIDDGILYYYSNSIENKSKVTLTAYKLSEHNILWQEDFDVVKNGTQSKLMVASDKNILFYSGKKLLCIDKNQGNLISSNTLDSNIIDILDQGDTLGIITQEGYQYTTLKSEIIINKYSPQYFSDVKAVCKKDSNSSYYIMNEDHDILCYQYVIEGKKKELYCSLDPFSGDFYHYENYDLYQDEGQFYYKNHSEKSFHKIELEKYGSLEDIRYMGIKEDCLVFFHHDYRVAYDLYEAQETGKSLYEYLIFDLKKKILTVEPVLIDYELWESIYQCTPTKDYLYYIASKNHRGKIYIYNRENHTTESFLYGKALFSDTILPAASEERIIVYDEGRLTMQVLDVANKRCVKEIFLNKVTSNIMWFIGYSMVSSDNDQYFAFADQNLIYVYDKDGNEQIQIPYDNHKDEEEVSLPYIFMPDDHPYLYYTYGDRIYQCDYKTGSIINTEKLLYTAEYRSHTQSTTPYFRMDDKNRLYVIQDDVLSVYNTDCQLFGKIFEISDYAYLDEGTIFTKGEDGIYGTELLTIDDIIHRAQEMNGKEEGYDKR